MIFWKSVIGKTRQVYNLFQDLLNNYLGFFPKDLKKVQKTVQTYIS